MAKTQFLYGVEEANVGWCCGICLRTVHERHYVEVQRESAEVRVCFHCAKEINELLEVHERIRPNCRECERPLDANDVGIYVRLQRAISKSPALKSRQAARAVPRDDKGIRCAGCLWLALERLCDERSDDDSTVSDKS